MLKASSGGASSKQAWRKSKGKGAAAAGPHKGPVHFRGEGSEIFLCTSRFIIYDYNFRGSFFLS